MITSREVGDLISEINMMLAVNQDSIFWLLEGITDVKFFKTRVAASVTLIECSGKYKLLNTMNRISSVNSLKHFPVLGIVDNDYDWLQGIVHPDNVVCTEPRDLEGILIRANCLECVLSEFGNPTLIRKFVDREGPVIEAILSRALLFGKIRAVNSLRDQVCLKAFKPMQFFEKGWTYNYASALTRAVRLGVADTVENLERLVAALPICDPWHYVRGHDAIDILCGGLMGTLGDKGGVGPSQIEPVLRQSLSAAQFKATHVHTATAAWHDRRSLPHPYIS